MPHLKNAFLKYQNDPDIAFLLVSIDEDDNRLLRYLDDMRFPFPVARLAVEQAEQLMGFNNVPSTFYIDGNGVIRYHVIGEESHGDSLDRVHWYIDRLKRQP